MDTLLLLVVHPELEAPEFRAGCGDQQTTPLFVGQLAIGIAGLCQSDCYVFERHRIALPRIGNGPSGKGPQKGPQIFAIVGKRQQPRGLN